ncbi:hypothetical protein TSAR_002776 [Trichomalopsis sarcophagae]|uniref:Methuselah N-terminal domain-containing protein n=1 Tax=Trichomalopsis sarcophagae TaxID=543379 RepID=A0A232FKF1_9HYME|nr:hypothetical protein TSAR_002776 [Trichomalopsis sarcophagae]
MAIKCVAARVQILLLLCLAPLPSHKCDDINPTTPQPPPCPEVLSVGIPEDEYRLEDDGDLVHRDRTYPVGSHWHDGNWTRGCVCHVAPKPCLRKCCAPGEILSTSLSRLDPCQPNDAGGAQDELKLDPQRTSSSMRHQLTSRPSIHDWFTLFKPSSQVCAEKFVFMDLNPDKYPEDAHVLHENGSLYMESTGLLGAERFCVDRQMARTGLTVIVCLEQTVPEEETSTAVRIGYVLSVPFLAVTFLVYAIIPELRNIYGKTLMCYVFALLSAYSTIFATNFVEFSTVCHILGEFAYTFTYRVCTRMIDCVFC